MKVLTTLSSPNSDGLTAACGEASRQGIVDGHSQARLVNLNDLKVARCAVHNDGWGTFALSTVANLRTTFNPSTRRSNKRKGTARSVALP